MPPNRALRIVITASWTTVAAFIAIHVWSLWELGAFPVIGRVGIADFIAELRRNFISTEANPWLYLPVGLLACALLIHAAYCWRRRRASD